jgi:hypothetical protein
MYIGHEAKTLRLWRTIGAIADFVACASRICFGVDLGRSCKYVPVLPFDTDWRAMTPDVQTDD